MSLFLSTRSELIGWESLVSSGQVPLDPGDVGKLIAWQYYHHSRWRPFDAKASSELEEAFQVRALDLDTRRHKQTQSQKTVGAWNGVCASFRCRRVSAVSGQLWYDVALWAETASCCLRARDVMSDAERARGGAQAKKDKTVITLSTDSRWGTQYSIDFKVARRCLSGLAVSAQHSLSSPGFEVLSGLRP